MCVCAHKRTRMRTLPFFSLFLPYYLQRSRLFPATNEWKTHSNIKRFILFMSFTQKLNSLSLFLSDCPSLPFPISLSVSTADTRYLIRPENKNKRCITETHFRQRPSITMYEQRTSGVRGKRAFATNTQNCECIT